MYLSRAAVKATSQCKLLIFYSIQSASSKSLSFFIFYYPVLFLKTSICFDLLKNFVLFQVLESQSEGQRPPFVVYFILVIITFLKVTGKLTFSFFFFRNCLL